MIYICLIIFLVLLDQLFKYIISIKMSLYQSIPIIDNFLYLTYVRNRGAAFSILQNQQLFFVILTIIVLTIITYYLFKNKYNSRLFNSSLALIISGGLGNLTDRIRLGYVTDFIDIRVWPVFNLADSLIVIGSILLIYYVLLSDNNNTKGNIK